MLSWKCICVFLQLFVTITIVLTFQSTRRSTILEWISTLNKCISNFNWLAFLFFSFFCSKTMAPTTNYSRIFELSLVSALLVLISVHLSYSCNEQVCASIVSKCMLTQSCKCDLKNCSCCSECFKCLSHLSTECCSCVGEFIICQFEFKWILKLIFFFF